MSARDFNRDVSAGKRAASQGPVVITDGFSGRILPIALEEARRATRLHVPDPRPERDAYIAATAPVHGLTVVTRNVADFEVADVPLLNPWTM